MAKGVVVRRFRSFRTSPIELVYLAILVAGAAFASKQVKAISSDETPRLAAADSALVRLSQQQDSNSNVVDPKIRHLAEQRRDLETAMNERHA